MTSFDTRLEDLVDIYGGGRIEHPSGNYLFTFLINNNNPGSYTNVM